MKGSISFALLALVVSLPLLAEETGEAVYVYTNADVERLEPIPTQSRPIAESDLGWEFVSDFIERERQRLDAARGHDLARERIENERLWLNRPRYGLAWAPYGFWGRRPGRGSGEHPPVATPLPGRHETAFRLHSPSGGTITPLHARPGGRITPLHARPKPHRGR